MTRASNPLGALVFREGYTEVEEVLGMRLRMEGDTPQTQYLVKWKVREPQRVCRCMGLINGWHVAAAEGQGRLPEQGK